jgi:hypothetical protein
MRLTDDEIQEWHEHVLKQRDKYRNLLEDICTGVPIIRGMASEYRSLTMEEIKKRAKELLQMG